MFIGHDILKTILQNPNMTWDFIWTHYGEIRRSRFFDENAFYGELSANTFGREIISEKEILRRRKRMEIVERHFGRHHE